MVTNRLPFIVNKKKIVRIMELEIFKLSVNIGHKSPKY